MNAVFLIRLFKESLQAIVIPHDQESRTFLEKTLFFLKLRVPTVFGMIELQKSCTFKIVILWKKLALYVHQHKDLLIR